jgi:hypothetical protein
MARLSWKRGKSREGMMRLAATYNLHYAHEHLATAQRAKGDLWFWYGDGINTAGRPDTLENVKAEVMKHFRAKMLRVDERSKEQTMSNVILTPAAAVDAICHEEQMVIWANDVMGALSMGNFLRDDLSYDEIVELDHAIRQEIKSIIGMALDHPEATTIRRRS